MAVRLRGTISVLALIYILAGIFVAWVHHYLTTGLLKLLLSAILAILLWPLVLLGVGLHLK